MSHPLNIYERVTFLHFFRLLHFLLIKKLFAMWQKDYDPHNKGASRERFGVETFWGRNKILFNDLSSEKIKFHQKNLTEFLKRILIAWRIFMSMMEPINVFDFCLWKQDWTGQSPKGLKMANQAFGFHFNWSIMNTHVVNLRRTCKIQKQGSRGENTQVNMEDKWKLSF